MPEIFQKPEVKHPRNSFKLLQKPDVRGPRDSFKLVKKADINGLQDSRKTTSKTIHKVTLRFKLLQKKTQEVCQILSDYVHKKLSIKSSRDSFKILQKPDISGP